MQYYISERVNNTPKDHSKIIIRDSKAWLERCKKYIKNSKYYQPDMQHNEDLLANVSSVVWHAEATYQDDLGQSKESRVIQYVNWELFRFIEKADAHRKRRFQDVSKFENKIAQPHSEFKKRDNANDIKTILKQSNLTKDEELVIQQRYFEGKKIKDIATLNNRTSQNVSQIHQQALAKVRRKAKSSYK